ncbi:restriction endonuclease subunit M [Polaribacter sp. WD7]|uniref:Eco57I restriction-modification methylase domain-containing protein n=1 Tax=Polaribacter sp. WD7 TaxID=2269061 RepID=UPI000DF2EB4A|nr:N-6 DNA methylase [Polaribacter sp. WD7]RCS26469.1 restriction endonuclease subunit M [Polaribacter sp. WD7]
MSLYQTSVLKNYINLQEDAVIEKAYKKYVKYFLNPTIQENIRSSKEEEYQGIFLTELFVNILGYTLKPKADFNLVAEYKNQTNSRKADGAILHNDIAIGVIELKGTNTKDLESIRKQAFDYKANQKGCVYVITSNFEKLRFYINDATEFEEFNLFELTAARFQLFYLCLQKDNIINNVPLKIKEASIVQEEKITKEFYKDYSLFKRELYRDLVKQNAKRLKSSNVISSAVEKSQEQLQLEKNVKLTLFKKSQKLIDRFLFIFFAEDRALLPANSTELILEKWKADNDFGDERPLYNLFKQYFHFLDQGRQGTKSRGEIYAYNGGLFKEDTLLDGLEIDNELLYKHTHKLAAYDFESQVDVNILGHIFENSLNEIESVNAEIEGANFDKQKSKRKKDGVFYTPKYITKYIVENTIGKLCEEKKVALGIKEEEYFKGRKNRNKSTITKLVGLLDEYRDWLLQLTICDPACGSGAFLNQALNFLIAEHTYIDELKTKVLGGGLQFSDIENTILENNIFGVDLNEESVEIAKLSLWLRTAQPRRKLNDLSSNIKCGNSLIDSKTVAGEKAFHWETQFPQVFEKGGFDVVIGNPPYGAELSGKKWLKNRFKESSFGNIDSYKYFIQLGSELLKGKGVLSYIMPDSYLEKEYFKDIRVFTSKFFKSITNIKLGDDVFEEVNLPTAIIVLDCKGEIASTYKYLDLSHSSKSEKSDLLFNQNKYITQAPQVEKTFVVIKSIIKKDNTIALIEVYEQVMGVKVYQKGKGKPKQTLFEKDNDVFVSKIKSEEFKYPYISQGINRYFYQSQNEFISYGEWLAEPRKKQYFTNPKIVVREIINPRIFATYIEENAVVKNIAAVLIEKDKKYPLKFLLGLLNSKLLTYYVNEQSPKSNNKSYPSFNSRLLKEIPIPICDDNPKNRIISNADIMSLKVSEKIKFRDKFIKYIKQKFQLEKLSKKLQNWHELEFGDFIKELNKAIKLSNKQRLKDNLQEVPTLTKKDEFEWLDLFEENKQKAQELQTQINQTDAAIDAMVYELYGLTDEEIAIVENS